MPVRLLIRAPTRHGCKTHRVDAVAQVCRPDLVQLSTFRHKRRSMQNLREVTSPNVAQRRIKRTQKNQPVSAKKPSESDSLTLRSGTLASNAFMSSAGSHGADRRMVV